MRAPKKLRERLAVIAGYTEPLMLERLQRLSIADLRVFAGLYGVTGRRGPKYGRVNVSLPLAAIELVSSRLETAAQGIIRLPKRGLTEDQRGKAG